MTLFLEHIVGSLSIGHRPFLVGESEIDNRTNLTPFCPFLLTRTTYEVFPRTLLVLIPTKGCPKTQTLLLCLGSPKDGDTSRNVSEVVSELVFVRR